MSGLGWTFDSNFRTRLRRATIDTCTDQLLKPTKRRRCEELVQRLQISNPSPRPTCCYQSILLQPVDSLEVRGARRLLGPCPHLPPLPLQPPHPLLPPLGPHCSKSPLL